MKGAQRAQALVFLTVALPMFVAVTGLAIDGALLFAARRQLQSVADGAARAGATRLDEQLLRDSGGSQVRLEPTTARSTALAYLREHLGRELPWAAEPDASVSVTQQRVHVAIRGGLRTAFLRVAQIERVPVDATAHADVQYGIRGPNGR